MGFSEVLTKIMDERGISMYALAKMLDCSQSTVKYWLSGTTNPQRGTMKRLAETLDVPVEVLQGKKITATDDRDGELQCSHNGYGVFSLCHNGFGAQKRINTY